MGRLHAATLFVASGLSLGLLVYAMVQENFLTEWKRHQRTYRAMLASSSDARQRELGARFEVGLRQLDVPALQAQDRCVACHVGIDNPAMANAAQPYRAHSGDALKQHPMGDYGCTICHRGQGAATNLREAQAHDAHWDYPLLPGRLTESSCGVCHAPDSGLSKKHAPKLALGRKLFVDRGCQGCHKLTGLGGLLGPALDDEGRKTVHTLITAHLSGERTVPNWLQQHFDSPQRIVPGSQMPPPKLLPHENEALVVYMLSLQTRDLPRAYIARDAIAALDQRVNHPTMDGGEIYRQLCAACHGDGTFGRWHPFYQRFMPAVRGPAMRSVGDSFLLGSVMAGRPGTIMPGWGRSGGGLTFEQVQALGKHLTAGDGQPAPKIRPAPDPLAGGNRDRGGELFAQQCAGCHGAAGEGAIAPALANSGFQQAASDPLIALTIVNGRPDTAMPAFQRTPAAGLTDQEVRDLLAHVRSFHAKQDQP